MPLILFYELPFTGMEQDMSRVLDVLKVSMIGLSVGVLAIGGCSESSSDHADHGDHAGHEDHAEETSHDEHAGHDHDHDDDAEMNNDAEARLDVYTGIQGELKSMPSEGIAGGEAQIRHMQIMDFKGADGEIPETADGIPGMRSMTMPFPMADGVSLDGFAVGDKVEFDFAVSWDGARPSWEVTRIVKLDPTVEIDFSNAKSEP